MLWGSLPESQCHHPFMDLANVDSVILPVQPRAVSQTYRLAFRFSHYHPSAQASHPPRITPSYEKEFVGTC